MIKNCNNLLSTQDFDNLSRLLKGGRLGLQVTTLGGGGTERYVQDMALGLNELGVNLVVIVDSPPLLRKNVLVTAGVDVVTLDISSNMPIEAFRRVFFEILTKWNVSFLHINNWLRTEEMKDVCKELNIPIVRTHHHTPLCLY
jgi:hypothetical protein